MRYTLAFTIAILLGCVACEHKTTAASETRSPDGATAQALPGVAAARLDRALVRFLNADPGGQPRELWVMDTQVFSGVPYKGITPYVEEPTKVLQFRVRAAGAKEDLVTDREELFAGRHYTLIAIPRKDGSSILLKVSDKLNPPKPGYAKMRVINATGRVHDLDLYRAGSTMKIKKGVDSDGVAGFADVQPGTFEIHWAKQPVSARLQNLAVVADRFYTFVVVGNEGDLDVVPIEDKLDAPAASE